VAVFIKEIKVENLGPISKLSLELKKFNVIFGRNEYGKTFLVEFILKSLFKSAGKWTLRKNYGQGKIVVSGLSEEDVSFSPGSSVKLEDFLNDNFPGLPPDLSRLLVVKGAELELSDNPDEKDKAIVKKYLSQKSILESIDTKISATERNARIENGEILCQRKGIGLDIEKLNQRYQRIVSLLDEVNRKFSSGEIANLESQLSEINKKIEVMERAKRYLAYTLFRKADSLRNKLKSIPQNLIKESREQLAVCRSKKGDVERLKKRREASEKNSRDYIWLKKFMEEYESLTTGSVPKVSKILLFSGIGAVAAGLITGLLKIVPFSVTAFLVLLGVVLFLLYNQKLEKSAGSVIERHELQSLKSKFKEKFKREFTKADVKELLSVYESDYKTFDVLSEQIPKEADELSRALEKLSNSVEKLCGEECTIDNAENLISKKELELDNLVSELQNIENRIARLGVDFDDTLTDPAETDFSEKEYEDLKSKAVSFKNKIEQEKESLTILKSDIAAVTQENITSSWETCIDKLRKMRIETVEELKDKKAKAFASNIVHRVIQNFTVDEDEKIRERLESSDLKTILKDLTGKYNSITIFEDDLVVSDGFHDFSVNNLSTGAQEQILLSLRVAFSRQIFKDNTIFLILDDAFQYSDWKRRELLVNGVSSLAENGWQIIYFTMDNHVRDLFDKQGRKFGKDYFSYELG